MGYMFTEYLPNIIRFNMHLLPIVPSADHLGDFIDLYMNTFYLGSME